MQRVSRLVRTVSLLSQRQLVVDSAPPSVRTFVRPNFIRNFSLSFTKMAYKAVERGCVNTTDYRVFITDADGNVVSPFHDIPLFSNAETKECNMVVEIPRWTNHKMEICKEEKMNPIKQDVKKGKVRFVKNCFPHHGYIWNYGALPQTWEDTEHTEPETGTKGDNDPVDVCEIGQTVHARGSIIQVKILGIMCLVDEGETDWKVICIDVKDPLAEVLNDIDDVEKHMPGFLKATEEWFRIYKIPDGKLENKFAFNGQAKNRAYALKVIEETHGQWKKLLSSDDDVQKGEIDCGLCCKNTKVGGSSHRIEQDQAQSALSEAPPSGEPASLPDDVDRWHYIPAALL